MKPPPIPAQIVIDDDVTKNSDIRSPIPSTLPLVDEIDLRQCFLFDKIPSAASMQGVVIGKEELNVMCGAAAAANQPCDHNNKKSSNKIASNNNIFISPNHQSPTSRKIIGGGDFKACPCCRRYIENLDHSVGIPSSGSTAESTVVTSSTAEEQQQQCHTATHKSNNNADNESIKMVVDEESEDDEYYGCWNLRRSMLKPTMGAGSLLSLCYGGIEDAWHGFESQLQQFQHHQLQEGGGERDTTAPHHPEEFNMAAPPLVQGDQIQHYTITETIVQGWLYKKGSGNDIFGRTWWKPRWVTLALAVFSGQTVPIPLIISHHAPGVPFPFHVMKLDESTVIMAIERTTKTVPRTMTKVGGGDHGEEEVEEWNRHCFQIVAKETTRIFTAPLQERNEWAFVINKQLYSFEQRMKKARVKEELGEYVKAQKEERKAKRLGMNVLLNEMREEEQQQQLEGRRPMSPSGRRSIGLPPRVTPPR